jgi:hypothetical protein
MKSMNESGIAKRLLPRKTPRYKKSGKDFDRPDASDGGRIRPNVAAALVESSNTEALEDGADFGGAGKLRRWFRAGTEECFDGGGIISGGAMPAVFGPVNGPAEGSAVEIVAVVFEIGFMGKEQLDGV